MKNIEGVPVIGISRHRLGTDGKGVTTLVAFHGCPLRCKYCINKACWESADQFKHYTPRQLYEELKQDDLYFRATGGGVTFGGGEPCLQADFIVDFRRLCGRDWKICIETSLHADREMMEKLVSVVDEWIVDVKAESDEAYKAYTGKERQKSIDNVSFLLVGKDKGGVSEDKVTFKIPVIPEYVSKEQAEESAARFRKSFGDAKVEVFPYATDRARQESMQPMGKKICDFLKSVRHEIADAYGLSFTERECKHQGDCAGTCPVCDAEVAELQNQLKEKNVAIESMSVKYQEKLAVLNDRLDGMRLEGMPIMGLMGEVEARYKPKKIFVKECALAGLSFHLEKDDELMDELQEGVQLALIRDKNNKYDVNAVAVALASDYDDDPENFDFAYILGYIPRSENAEIAAMMDAGYAEKFSAEITSYKRYGNYNNRIRLTLYIESKEPELVRPDLLRAESLSTSELREMVESLEKRGTAYFRWGGYSLPELAFPAVGERVVMVHRDKDSEVLYLMRVLAVGDDCSSYMEFPEEIHNRVDDCESYILTNLMGPVRIEKNNHEFLVGLDLKGLSATEYLPPRVSKGFELYFHSLLVKTLNRNNIDSDPSIDE